MRHRIEALEEELRLCIEARGNYRRQVEDANDLIDEPGVPLLIALPKLIEDVRTLADALGNVLKPDGLRFLTDEERAAVERRRSREGSDAGG